MFTDKINNNTLISHMEDLAGKAQKAGVSVSRFLTPAEIASISNHFKFNKVKLIFDGGFEAAERKRAVFLNEDRGIYNKEDFLSGIKFAYRMADTLTHRDVLGSIMALGIERDTIGDILCTDGNSFVVCIPEMNRYIIDNITKIGRIGVSATEISIDELPILQEVLETKTASVASLRLDAVLSVCFKLSRSKAAEAISAGRVYINHLECIQPSKELTKDDLISVRGTGRAKLLDICGKSKKGRLLIEIGLYQ